MIATFAEIDRKYQQEANAEKHRLAHATLQRLGGLKFTSMDDGDTRRQNIAEHMDLLRGQIMDLQEKLMLLQYLADSYAVKND
jgi:hypothetical protein